jgi:cytochrome c oxidase subunit I
MFTTGVVLLPFFSLMSYLIAVPTGIKFFNWIGTMWRGSVKFDTSMLFAIGFLVTFLLGGVTGILLASPPIDFATHDTYFVVAHFHSVVMGLAMAAFAGFFYWYPKITGRMLREKYGKISFWLMLVGANVTILPQYVLGLEGMPRRIAEYSAATGWTTLNRVSSLGAVLLFLSVATFLVNVFVSWRNPIPAGDNPWDAGTLEWATTSPPPHHNFYKIPPIRSERPVWDANHPEHPHVHPKRLRILAAFASNGSSPSAGFDGDGVGGPGAGDFGSIGHEE